MLMLCMVLCTASSVGFTAGIEDKQQFEIPAQPLADALKTFSQRSGLQLFYDANLVAGKTSKGLNGAYSPEQALAQLLAESGLSYQIKNANTVVLEQGKQPPPKTLLPLQDTPTTLPKVNVVGNAIYDAKDPYNQDYVLPNATTGTKTDTPVMETPLNVQVISKQVLKDQQVTSLDQALKNVSGVTTNSAQGFSAALGGTSQSTTLRGFTSNLYMRNGFRLQDGAATREMANVESVEVLKGAAAILYGQVEPGGMVNVITKQPLATPYYSAQQQFGSYNMYRTTLDATGPVTDNKNLLYRMNMSYENSGSYRDYVQNEKIYVAPIIKWAISDKTQATFELEYTHDNLGLDTPFMPTYNGQFIKIPRNWNYLTPANGPQDNILGAFNWSHQFNDDWSIKHSFVLNQQSQQRSLLAPYTPQFSPTLDTIDRSFYHRNTNDNTYSTNLDLTGHFETLGLKHTLLFGGDFYHYHQKFVSNIDDFRDFKNDTYNNILNPVQAGLSWDGSVYSRIPAGTPNAGMTLYSGTDVLGSNWVGTTDMDQYGLYLQDQIKLPYDIHVMGGFRYQYLHNKDGYQAASLPNKITALTQEAVTPRVGLLWQPQNWLSLYSNYTENFGANQGYIWPNGAPVPATGANQWEVGAKTEFFDGRLRATLAYFDLTKTNIATSDNAPGHQGYSLVIGGVRSRGPELDIQGEILPGWNMIATYSNTDIMVTKGVSGSDYPVVGSRYFGVPRNTGSFWNTYEFQDEMLKGFKLGGGITLRDGQLANTGANTTGNPDAPASMTSIPGYATVDLLAAYSLKVGKSKVTGQLNVNNLLDKYYVTSASYGNYPTAQGFDAAYVGFGAPRTLMGSIRIEY
jgi:iron complex outermembrane receptor protein